MEVSEVQASAPLPSDGWHTTQLLPQPTGAMRLGVQAHLVLSLFPADIGPVTLTADPAVFQRELRELYVQVGCPLCPSAQSMPEAKVFAPPGGQGGASCNRYDLPPSSAWGCPPAWGSCRFCILGVSFLYSVNQVPTGLPVPGMWKVVIIYCLDAGLEGGGMW